MRSGFLFALCVWTAISGLSPPARADDDNIDGLGKKLQPYISCINSVSEYISRSRDRYLSWAAPTGPTGKESIVYGTYALSNVDRCAKGIEQANALSPHEADLEEAGDEFAKTTGALEPIVKEAVQYYEQGDYKDDKMAKGKALHPRLMAAWAAATAADRRLRDVVERLNDRVQLAHLAEVEKTEGRGKQFLLMSTMLTAKRLMRVEMHQDLKDIDLARTTEALQQFEATVMELDQFADGPDHKREIDSMFLNATKDYLITAKNLMRRVRDKTPYSTGEKMNLGNSLSGWMVEGSPPRLLRDYNQLVERYNSTIRRR